MEIKTYKDLIVWEKAMSLVVAIYEVTEKFPNSEVYGLTSQMRRAAVSIVSNIAEGKARGGQKEYRHFLLNSYGSGAELETQVLLAKRLAKIKELNYTKVDGLLEEVMKILHVLIVKLKN